MVKTVKAQNLEEAIAALHDPDVIELDCSSAGMGDRDLAKLAPHLPASAITRLNLWSNQISDAGVAALAPYLPSSAITVLGLGFNRISDAGVAALAPYLPSSAITRLNLDSNPASESQCKRAEELCATTRASAGALVAEWDETRYFMQEEWLAASRLTPAMAQYLAEEARLEPAAIRDCFLTMSKGGNAHSQPVRDFILKALPLGEALQWLEAHGKKIESVTELLNPDGTFPQDRIVCQRGMYALLHHPDLWESRAQAEHAIRSLPEAVQAILPTRQLFATLSRRDATKQQGRG